MQGTISGAVGVPQALDGLRPLGNLLNLVEHQHESPQLFRLAPGFFPVAHQPFRVSHLWRKEGCLRRSGWDAKFGRVGFIDSQVAAFEVNLPQCLAHDGGLAGLARPEQGNKLPGRLGEPAVERGDLRTLEGCHTD